MKTKILFILLLIFSCGEKKDSNEHNIFKGNKNPDGTLPDGVLSDGVYRDKTINGYDNNKNSVSLKIKDNLIYKGNKLYNGILISYFDNGDINFEGNITDGKKHGLMKGYYNNNQIGYEVNYKNGIKHGKHTMYYENGNLSEEGNFIDGKEEGLWVTVDSLGYINKGNYKNGKREGIWYWYYVDSKTLLDTIKVEEELYKEGILIETKSTIPQPKKDNN